MTKIITVDFHPDTLFAAERDDGVFVAVTPICDRIGVASQKQRERIMRDPILSEGATMMVFPSPGGMQETLCLRLDLVNGWLFGIDERRVKPESREAVLRYKRECYRVLFEHFYGKAKSLPGEDSPQPNPSDRTGRNRFTMEEWQTHCRVLREYRIMFDVEGERWMAGELGMPIPPKHIYKKQSNQRDFFDEDDGDDEPKAA